ncbi:MAG: putative metal-binding motif-containing protein [Deltaproteobacteria bacterium]|nr:putative metal-binding motif-containing protein [Deltaproteobacteria bacterium]
MTPLTDAPSDAPIAPRESATVTCTTTGTSWRSGFAWQPVRGPQLRLLLPELGVEGLATDASSREADLDCDGRRAGHGDCDDLRREFHEDADERCDGLDTNCDGRTLFTQACDLPAGVCGPQPTTGVQLCVDTDDGHTGACRADAACACGVGTPGPCRKCVLDFELAAPAGLQMCAPAIGKVKLAECANGCRVQVVSATGPWKPQVANVPDGAFGSETTTAGVELFLRVKATENPIPAAPAQSVGAVYLAVASAPQNLPEIVAIDLETGFQPAGDCVEVGNGDFAMSCGE